MTKQPYALYNPAMLAPGQLLAEFTARQTTLDRLVDVVRNNRPGHPPQHALICGPRGMGKTTLLWAVAHSINLREPELAKQWQPVPFDEESRRIGDLADFWLECIRQWEAAIGSSGDAADELLDLPPERIEDAARQTFLKLVDTSGKRALLLVDNVNDVFRNVDGREALHRLRAFMMDDDRIMLIGACVELSEDVTSVEKPFFDFFRIIELKPLTFEEVRDCLNALADARGDVDARNIIDKREGGLRAIHLLTGGNPRLVKTFYRLLKDGLHRDIRVDLEKLLDEFTPYFKAIVDALPAQQQRIFDAVALAWNPVEVAHVARQARLASNKVSSQLRYMIKSGHIAEVASQSKKKSYMLADRFSNVHYLMRHGRAARIRFDWFVVMVRLLFEDVEYAKELAVMAKDSVIDAAPGWEETCGLVANAMERAETPKARKLLIGQFVTAQNPENITHLRLAEIACDKALEIDPADADAHFKKGRVEEYLGWDSKKAAASYAEAVRLNPSHIEAWGALAWVNHRMLHNEEAAEAAYLKALELNPEAWWIRTNYGSFLQEHTTRYEEAEREFRTVGDKDPEPRGAWFNLGNLLKSFLKRPADAEEAYYKSIKADGTYAPPVIGLALLYREQGRDYSEYAPLAIKAMGFPPYRGYDLGSFMSLCGKDKDAISQVLPLLCRWCAGHSDHVDLPMVYSFSFTLWMRLMNLAGADETLDLMQTIAEEDLKPFEALTDVFRTKVNPSHLHSLAPERAKFVTELLSGSQALSASRRAKRAKS
jgi:tetratricopeptide (TPR) repeat protein